MKFGICCNVSDAQEAAEAGFDYFESGVGSALVPEGGDEEWASAKAAILAAPIPMLACNNFLPWKFRLTGPAADHAPALAYAEKACRRADEVGCRIIVFGSGGARNVPGDILGPDRPDIEAAERQFEDFCGELAGRIAGCSVTVAIEPLRPNESNIVNYVWQAVRIVGRIGSPRIRALADFFHMIRGGEDARSIVDAGALLAHCHVAEGATRAYPGHANPGELSPYFQALRLIGYEGCVSCECSWPLEEGQTPLDARRKALETLKSLSHP